MFREFQRKRRLDLAPSLRLDLGPSAQDLPLFALGFRDLPLPPPPLQTLLQQGDGAWPNPALTPVGLSCV